MAVHQVEEYYICMTELELTEESKASIEKLLSDEGYSTYEFQDDDTCLVVDGIPDEGDGYTLESQIKEIL